MALIWNKAVLEPCVSPAFAITYFCNHCNILDLKIHQSMWIHWPFFPKTWTKGHWSLDDLWPHVCWGHMCDSTQGSLCPSPMTIHQCMWIQWSILQNTTYIYILRTYYVLLTYYVLHTYYVQNEWSHSLLLNSVQARQKGLFLTYFSHFLVTREKLQKFLQHISHSHTCIHVFCSPYWLFLPYQFWKKIRIYQVRFLFGISPQAGVDSYSCNFGTINK